MAGLLAIGSARLLFDDRQMKEISRRNAVSWSPRQFGGKEDGMGGSPVFGVAWTLIFVLQFVGAGGGLVAGVTRNLVSDEALLFNQAGCIGGALLISSLWTPVFQLEKQWTFAVAAAMLVVVAILATIAAIVSSVFVVDMQWWEVVLGVSSSIFGGWTIVAAGLNIGITTQSYNHGVSSANNQGESFFPLVLSILVAVFSVLFGNSLLCAPLFVALFFVKNAFSDWKIWGSMIICAIGAVGGAGMVFVYREVGVWW